MASGPLVHLARLACAQLRAAAPAEMRWARSSSVSSDDSSSGTDAPVCALIGSEPIVVQRNIVNPAPKSFATSSSQRLRYEQLADLAQGQLDELRVALDVRLSA